MLRKIRVEVARLEAERIAKEKAAKEAAEKVEVKAKVEEEAKAKEEAEHLAREREEAERLAAEKAKQEAFAKAELKRLAKEKAEERLAKETAEKARLEAEKKAEAEAKKNQNGTGSEIPVVPTQPEQSTKPVEEPTKPIEEPVRPEVPAEDSLVIEKGDPAYHEVPAFDISEITKQLDSGNKAGKLEEQSSAHESNMDLKAGESTVREVQNTSTVLQNSAEKSVYSRVERAKTLPNTGQQTNSSILQMVGLGLASLGLVVKRKNINKI